MATKLKSPALTTTIQEDKIYIDISKLDNVIQTLKKEYLKIKSCLERLVVLVSEAKQANLEGCYEKLANDLVKSCKEQAGYTQGRIRTLSSQYETDRRSYEIALLKNNLKFLEKAVQELKKSNTNIKL